MRVNLISSSLFNAVCFSFQVGLIRNFVNDQVYRITYLQQKGFSMLL